MEKFPEDIKLRLFIDNNLLIKFKYSANFLLRDILLWYVIKWLHIPLCNFFNITIIIPK